MALKTPKEQAATDLAAFYSIDMPWTDTATYTPSGGEAVSITIIPEETDPSIMVVPPPGDGKSFRVRHSEVANPLQGDVYTISGDTWYFVENIPGDFVDEWKLLVSRSDKRRIG